MPGTVRRVFVVVRSWWFYNDEEMVPGTKEPLKAFTDRQQAELFRRRCEEDEHVRHQVCYEDPDDNHFTIIELDVEA